MNTTPLSAIYTFSVPPTKKLIQHEGKFYLGELIEPSSIVINNVVYVKENDVPNKPNE